MQQNTFEIVKGFILRTACKICQCDIKIEKAQNGFYDKYNSEYIDKELNKFKLLSSKSRYSYIRNLALDINLERIHAVLNEDDHEEYSTIYSLDYNESHFRYVSDFEIVEPDTYCITSVWSREKLSSNRMKDYVQMHGLEKSLSSGDVDGFYLVNYGILYTYNDNHRICHAQLLNDFSINVDNHYRIKKIMLTDKFLNISVDSLKDIYLTKTEKLMYKAMQVDQELNLLNI